MEALFIILLILVILLFLFESYEYRKFRKAHQAVVNLSPLVEGSINGLTAYVDATKRRQDSMDEKLILFAEGLDSIIAVLEVHSEALNVRQLKVLKQVIEKLDGI